MNDTMRGIFAALPTPLTTGGDVDAVGLHKLVNYVLAGGVNGLWVLGSTSEFPCLSEEERRVVLTTCIDAARGRVPVIVGVTSLDIRKVSRHAEEAGAAGADACFVVLPFYFTLDRVESVRYIRAVAESVPLPLLLYDNPFASGVRLDADTLLELTKLPNFIGIKDSSGDFSRFQKLVTKLNPSDSWCLLQGMEHLAAPSLVAGAHGAVLAMASIAPDLCAGLHAAVLQGDLSVVDKLHKRMLRLCQLYELTGGPTDGAFFAGVKAALEVLGICSRVLMPPFSPMPVEMMSDVEELLRHCEVFAGSESIKNERSTLVNPLGAGQR